MQYPSVEAAEEIELHSTERIRWKWLDFIWYFQLALKSEEKERSVDPVIIAQTIPTP